MLQNAKIVKTFVYAIFAENIFLICTENSSNKEHNENSN